MEGDILIISITMPTFRITQKNRVTNTGIRVEPGMTVDAW